MAYSQQTWTDGATGGTPVTAARLAHIEAGLGSAATVADTADSNAASVRADLTSLINTVNAQAALLTQLQQALAAGGGGTGGGWVYAVGTPASYDATNLPDGTPVVLLSADPTTA